MESQLNIFEVIARHAREAGHVVAAIDDAPQAEGTPSHLPPRLTYSELHAAAERLSVAIGARIAVGHRRAPNRAALATRMRRGNEWYTVFCAAARLGLPLVALSTDLTDKTAEAKRNAEILAEHQPALIITDDDWRQLSQGGLGASAVVKFRELWASVPADATGAPPVASVGADATLCFCYTGGTTEASRCAMVSHGMALHEVDAYPTIVKMGRSDRIMQQHSLYWAASAYGEVDIALAFGCALVFCEAWDAEGVAAAVQRHKLTCAGLVPSVLSAVSPVDVPSLAVVFTWGEALPAKVAQDWTRRVQLIDLLISTESWLSLYADWNAFNGSSERPPFRTVRRTQVRLRPPANGSADDPATATAAQELMVAGPMVTPGYTDPRRNEVVLLEDAGVRWYCTRDCVEPCADGGFTFAGRADDLIKVGGKWVDARDVERRLEAISGVAAARVVNRDIFVVLEESRHGVVPSVRRAVPADFALFVVPALPRRAGTDKVDRQRLAALVTHSMDPAFDQLDTSQSTQLMEKLWVWYRPLWLLVVAALVFAAVAIPPPEKWMDPTAAVMFLVPFCLRAIWELLWRLVCLSYLLLVMLHWHQASNQLTHCPLGHMGFCIFLASVLPGPLCGGLVALPGIKYAAERRRLVAWPLVCVAGFPYWMRGSGAWWVNRGFSGVAKWYRRSAANSLRQLLSYIVKVFQEVSWRIRKLFGCGRECFTCKARCAISDGHVELAVDECWHCERCWRDYHRHQQCHRCHSWTTRGDMDSTGTFTCRKCEPLLPKEGGEAGTAAARHEPDAAAGQGGNRGGQGGGYRNNGWRPRPEVHWRTIGPISDLPAHSPSDDCRASAAIAADATADGTAAVKSVEWRLIERATGWTFSSKSDSLAGLDSLRTTKIASLFRREAGIQLTRESLKRCTTLGQLLDEIRNAARTPIELNGCGPGNAQEHAAWLMMWNTRCQWTLVRDRPLSEAALREAVQGLVERHPALRVELADPAKVFTAAQQALSVLSLWRRVPTRGGRLFRAVRRAGLRAVSWGLQRAWGRVRVGESRPPSLIVLPHCTGAEEAHRSLWNLPRFAPPFQVALVPFGANGAEEGALVHILVTHMLSDGYSIVPLLADLAQLVARAEGATASPQELVPLPPPVPCALSLLSDRIMRTISGVKMPDAVTLDALDYNHSREGVTVLATMPEELVAALRRAARGLEVSDDIVMLTAIGATLARFEGRASVPISMIAPQRDGPGQGDVVGLFADIRLLGIRTEGLSYLGTALRLHHIVKERLWSAPHQTLQFDVPLVNFEWTDFESHHGFKQLVHMRNGSEQLSNNLKVAVDQPDRATWRLRTAFDGNIYSTEDRERFFEILHHCLRALVEEPLALVWPDEAAIAGGRDGGPDLPVPKRARVR